MLLTICLLCAVSAVFSLYKQLQMLQQNSYFPSRYFGWLKNDYTVILAVLSFTFCVISLLNTRGLYIAETVLSVLILAVRVYLSVKTHKKSIKKLVFTGRIKRLYATAIILLSALIITFTAAPKTLAGKLCFALSILLSVVTPLLVFVIWTITKPVETVFNRYYINDAKKMLASHGDITVIGITGSYGKTTTKFILNRILSENFNVLCTPHSYNTPMGVVRTVRESLKPQTQIFICEMGAKKKGDIKEICDIVNPKYGIVTSVGAQHLDTFLSTENVFKTKFELKNATDKAGGVCIANIESSEIASRKERLENAVFFGEGTDYRAENIRYSASGSSFTLILGDQKADITTRLLGKHSVSDIVAAAAMAHILGVDIADIRFAISSLKPTEHRLELKPFNGSLLIDDAYNSNPEGCIEALNILNSFENMQKTVITPGLIELGEREYEANYNLGLAAAKVCDNIILVGKNRSKPMRDAIATTDFDTDRLYIAESFKDAMRIYSPICDENSVVLIENDLPDNYLN